MLYVFRSDTASALFDAMLSDYQGRSAPFCHPEICTQGHLVGWVKQQMSRRLGICISQPVSAGQFLDELLQDLPGFRCEDEAKERPDADLPFAGDVLLWTLFNEVVTVVHTPEFDALTHYFKDDMRVSRVIGFCQVMVELYQEYMVYRPDMLLAFEDAAIPQTGHAAWQAALWRRVVRRLGRRHFAARARYFLQHCQTLADYKAPERKRPVYVFGVSTLPPIHLTLFAALSQQMDVFLFVVTPCPDLFQDARREGDAHAPLLLANMGKVGADFQRLLLDLPDDLEIEERDLFGAPPEPDNALRIVQHDIRRHIPMADRRAAPFRIDPADLSIQYHICHSPQQETEMARNIILDAVEHLGVTPQDVLLMAPDMSIYAPFVESVLGDPLLPIPYVLHNTGYYKREPVGQIAAALLELTESALSLGELFDFLSLEPVRRRWGVSSTEVERWLDLFRECGVRGFIDADHRERHDNVPYFQNTWRFGFERLFLGFAMGDEASVWQTTTPFPALEGAGTEGAGRFVAFCERLFSFIDSTADPRSLSDWISLFEHTCMDIAQLDTAHSLPSFRKNLDDLSRSATLANGTPSLEWNGVKPLLTARVERWRIAGSQGRGGVECCSFRHLRGRTWKLVVLLGMNESVFPQVGSSPAISDVFKNPRIGDRNSSQDDRYMFLEAVLAATHRLVIASRGPSTSDPSGNPSCVVADLLDVLDDSVSISDLNGSERIRDRVTTIHPIATHSPSYFDGRNPRLFSYRTSDCLPNSAETRTTHTGGPWQSPVQVSIPATVSAGDLCRFWRSPVAYYVRYGMGIDIAEPTLTDEADAFWELNGLEKWSLGDRLMDAALIGEDGAKIRQIARGAGQIPHGHVGDFAMDAVARKTESVTKCATHLGCADLHWRHVEVTLLLDNDTCRVTGMVPTRTIEGMTQCSYGEQTASRLLQWWIHSLLYFCDTPLAQSSIAVFRHENNATQWRLSRPETPAALLEELVRLMVIGSDRPLSFEPTVSFDYWRLVMNDAASWELDKRVESARSYLARVADSETDPGRRAFAQGDGFDHDDLGFIALAKRVIGPLYACLEEMT